MKRITICLMTLTLLTGCGGGDKSKDPTGSPSPVASPSPSPSPSVVIGGIELPKDFPADVPVYPGSKLVFTARDGDKKVVHLMSADAPAKVFDFYEAKLKNDGWAVLGTTRVGEGGTLGGKKGERTCGVVVAGAGGTTSITLAVGTEGKEDVDPPTKEDDEKKVKVIGVPLPKDTPRDVPLYPDARVTAAINIMDGLSISLTTSHKMEKVFAYFTAKLRDLGWKELLKAREDMNFTLAGEKEGRILTISGTQDETETVIVIGLAKKPK